MELMALTKTMLLQTSKEALQRRKNELKAKAQNK
jgi:hypothetical protein